ncbi:MAG: argininosuccinate lyase [Chloroflexi bacterium]|nr:argininosuccinate lyase [Chloroflexota bacterium]
MNAPERQTLWGGRFEKSLDARALRYTTSLPVDKRLFELDVLASIAHARMLGYRAIIPGEDADAIVHGLADLLDNPPDLETDAFEDVHSLVETELARRIGESAGRLHTARSRNDQIATDIRMYCRAALVDGVMRLLDLQAALLDTAEHHAETLISGYTHTQRAQPVTLGHHMLAYSEMLERDISRLMDAYPRADVLPLGSGALAGAPYPLDRGFVATLLGFGSVSRNSLDAVSDRDFLLEHLAALSVIAMHLSRLAEELVLWSTAEFGFVQLDEAFTTGSSIMPQKRNPDVAELLRGKTGRVYASLFGLLVTLKGLPLSYNRDLQEDKQPYFEAVEVLHDGLALAAAMMSSATWRTDRLGASASDGLIGATDLADHLTRRGLPFRQAHEVVGHIVRAAESSGRRLADFSLADLQTFCSLFDATAVGLEPTQMVAARDLEGGPAPTQVRRQLAEARTRHATSRAWAEQTAARLPTLATVMQAPPPPPLPGQGEGAGG